MRSSRHRPSGASVIQVGLVGCGAIGTALARAIERDYSHAAQIVAMTDVNHARALTLQRRLTSHPPIVSLATLVRRSRLVIEAASGAIAARVARSALARDRDVLVMSSGGLLTDASWRRAARRSRGRLHVPSGALAGLDAVKAMAVGAIRRVHLTTSKPPRALASAPGLRLSARQLLRLRRPRTVFEGTPAQTVKAFPQNTNVAATLMLAVLSGRRPRRSIPVRVRVVADPALRINRHEVEVEGDCGRMRCLIESRASAMNPKTSETAIRSAIATLHQLFQPIRIGT